MTQMSTIISEKQRHQIRKIKKSVHVASYYAPWEASCKEKAIVTNFWCIILKIPHVIYIGFAKPKGELGFQAMYGHAWVTAGSEYVSGDDIPLIYTVVSSYLYLPKAGRLFNGDTKKSNG